MIKKKTVLFCWKRKKSELIRTLGGILHLLSILYVPDTELDPWDNSVQSLSCAWLCDPMDCSTVGFPVHHQLWSLLKLMSIESVMPSNHLILCHPFPLLTSVFPSIRVFSNDIIFYLNFHRRWRKRYSKRRGVFFLSLMSKNTHFTAGKTSVKEKRHVQDHTRTQLEPGYPALQASVLPIVHFEAPSDLLQIWALFRSPSHNRGWRRRTPGWSTLKDYCASTVLNYNSV